MKIFIATEIAKPRAPTTRSPIAVTFEIVLNSCIVGFFRRRQTRRYLLYCVLSALAVFPMFVCGGLGF